MCFTKEKIGNIDMITLSGRLDTDTSEKLNKKFDEVCETGSGKTIVVMNDVDYISSSMIRILLKSLKKHRAKDGDFQLVGLQPQIMKVMKIAGMDTLFLIFKDKESALREFQK
jgi:anti-anti-sigma factor